MGGTNKNQAADMAKHHKQIKRPSKVMDRDCKGHGSINQCLEIPISTGKYCECQIGKLHYKRCHKWDQQKQMSLM